MGNELKKVIRRGVALMITALCGLTVWGEDNIIQNGIVYTFLWAQNFKEKYPVISDVLDEAGSDIHFPETIQYGGTTYEITTFGKKSWSTGMSPSSPIEYYISWTNKDIRSVSLPKTLDYPYYFRNDLEPRGFLLDFDTLQDVNIASENPRQASYEGIVYLSSGANKYASCFFTPKKNNRNGVVRLHPQTEKLCFNCVAGNTEMKMLIVPASVRELEFNEIGIITGNTRLEKIIFEDRLITDISHYGMIDHNLALREIAFKRTDEVVDIDLTSNRSVVKLSSLKDAKEVRLLGRGEYGADHVWNPFRVMVLDCPDVETIDENAIGWPQAVTIGSCEDLSRSNYKIHKDWLDREAEVTVCMNALTPPAIEYKEEEGAPKQWTVYVPAEAVEAYAEDPYWSSVSKEILPITDKLIPLVSEPELEIEQWKSHEYLWDVMTLGNAEAAETGVWSSDNEEVATIDQNGKLKAVGMGEATITFTLEDKEGNVYTAESKVTVIENVSAVEEIEAEEVAEDGKIQSAIPDGVYNLHGQRVGDSTEGLVPGLYIVVRGGTTEKLMVK